MHIQCYLFITGFHSNSRGMSTVRRKTSDLPAVIAENSLPTLCCEPSSPESAALSYLHDLGESSRHCFIEKVQVLTKLPESCKAPLHVSRRILGNSFPHGGSMAACFREKEADMISVAQKNNLRKLRPREKQSAGGKFSSLPIVNVFTWSAAGMHHPWPLMSSSSHPSAWFPKQLGKNSVPRPTHSSCPRHPVLSDFFFF